PRLLPGSALRLSHRHWLRHWRAGTGRHSFRRLPDMQPWSERRRSLRRPRDFSGSTRSSWRFSGRSRRSCRLTLHVWSACFPIDPTAVWPQSSRPGRCFGPA
ncbi:unnamed protein product, partial [Polarella glacialis]